MPHFSARQFGALPCILLLAACSDGTHIMAPKEPVELIRSSLLTNDCANPHPDWIFCEDYESTDWAAKWGEISHPTRLQRVTTQKHGGVASLRLKFPVNDQNGPGWMHYWWEPDASQNIVYLRWWTRYDLNFNWGNWDVKMNGLQGLMPEVLYVPACVHPDGLFYSMRASARGVTSATGVYRPREPVPYVYHLDQPYDCGQWFPQVEPRIALVNGQWHCIELSLKPNTPGQYDGEWALWVDGTRVTYVVGKRLRTDANAQIRDLFMSGWIGEPLHTTVQYRWEDDIVVSTSPIGC